MRPVALLLLAACNDIDVDLDVGDSDDSGSTPVPWTGPEAGDDWRPDDATELVAGDPEGGVGVWLADVTGDANADLIRAWIDRSRTRSEGWLRIDVLTGLGDASFAPSTTVYGGSPDALQIVTLADVTGDGRPDLFNAETDTVNLFEGNGAGFAEPVAISVPGLAYGAAGAVDLEGDGLPEIVVAALDTGGIARTEVLGRASAADPFTYEMAFRPGNYYAPNTVIARHFGSAAAHAVLGTGTSLAEGGGAELAYVAGGSPEYVHTPYADVRAANDPIHNGFEADLGDGVVLVTEGVTGLEFLQDGLAHSVRANDATQYGLYAVPVDLEGDGDTDLLELGSAPGARSDDPDVLTLLATTANPAGLSPASASASALQAYPYYVFHAIDAADLDGDGCAEVVFLGGYAQSVYLARGVCN